MAAAAYRSGERLVDDRLEMQFDYRARGGVEHSEIMLPEGAPAAFGERSTLWNAVEAAEKRYDAQVAREVQLSLPHELNLEQRQELVREFVQSAFVDRGMIADVALHSPDAEGDQRNYHAHIMLTTRTVGEDGFGAKNREWNSRETLAEWRAEWAAVQNRHLEKVLGPDAPRVSHKSLEAQGIDREATIHLGPTASAIERKGEVSERGAVNREIAAENGERRTLAREQTAVEVEANRRAPQTESTSQMLHKELTEYDADMRRQVATWKAEQAALKPAAPIKAADVRREIVGPAKATLRDAERNLERTRERTQRIAGKRTSLASFIRNPQRAIWAKIREVHAIDRARRDVARARAGVRVREQWMRSDQGRAYTLKRVDKSTRDAIPARQKIRALDRKVRRVEKRIRAVEKVRERILIADQLGVKSWQRPVKVASPDAMVRQIDAAAMKVFQRATTQQIQQARQTVRTIGLSRGFTR